MIIISYKPELIFAGDFLASNFFIKAISAWIKALNNNEKWNINYISPSHPSPAWKGNYNYFKSFFLGFPGGAVVESLPANAGHTGSSPGLGGSHMPRSSWAREPHVLSLRVWSLCSATREAAIVRGPRTVMKSGPRSPQLEKALAQRRRPNTAKNNK